MRVFVDTNVLMDFVCRREPFVEDAKRLFAMGYMGEVTLLTSALSLVNVMYVAHKYNHDEVRESLIAVAKFVEVCDLEGSTVVEMLSSGWSDYEDATQNRTAMLAMADCIVTRNKKDFATSALPVYTVPELLAHYNV